jgi:hypothetical protein
MGRARRIARKLKSQSFSLNSHTIVLRLDRRFLIVTRATNTLPNLCMITNHFIEIFSAMFCCTFEFVDRAARKILGSS